MKNRARSCQFLLMLVVLFSCRPTDFTFFLPNGSINEKHLTWTIQDSLELQFPPEILDVKLIDSITVKENATSYAQVLKQRLESDIATIAYRNAQNESDRLIKLYKEEIKQDSLKLSEILNLIDNLTESSGNVLLFTYEVQARINNSEKTYTLPPIYMQIGGDNQSRILSVSYESDKLITPPLSWGEVKGVEITYPTSFERLHLVWQVLVCIAGMFLILTFFIPMRTATYGGFFLGLIISVVVALIGSITYGGWNWEIFFKIISGFVIFGFILDLLNIYGRQR